MKGRSPERLSITQHWATIGLTYHIIDGASSSIIYVDAEAEERRPKLSDLAIGRSQVARLLGSRRAPCAHVGVLRRVQLIYCIDGTTDAPRYVVRDAAALRSVRRRSKATALIELHAIERCNSIPPQLILASTHLSIVGSAVEAPELDWCATRFEYRCSLCNLRHPNQLIGRPRASTHRSIDRVHEATVAIRHRMRRRPAEV